MGKQKLDKVRARALYDRGWTDAAIAEALEVHPNTVTAWRHGEGRVSRQSLDRAAARAREADEIAAAKRRSKQDPCRESLESAVDHARELGMSYGHYMAAKRCGTLPHGH